MLLLELQKQKSRLLHFAGLILVISSSLEQDESVAVIETVTVLPSCKKVALTKSCKQPPVGGFTQINWDWGRKGKGRRSSAEKIDNSVLA